MSTIWEAVAEPVGRFWHIQVKGIDGATQARKASEVDEMVRDFISTHSGESASRIKLNLLIQLPKEVQEALAKADKLRSEAETARKAAAQETSRAAQLLKEDGLTVRDIGLALGLSFQRAQQLLKGNSQ